MRKRAPHERIESYRRRVHAKAGHALRDDLAAWVSVIRADLADVWPDLPAGIEDRNADIWEPLLAIADAAGGHWPERAREAAVAIVKGTQASVGGFGLQLLADLRSIFTESHEQAMTTEAILTALCDLDESPWADIRGKSLDARNLSRRLGKYGIKPKVIRVGDKTPRGYERADLLDAWVRYLPDAVADVALVADARTNGRADVAPTECPNMKFEPTHPEIENGSVTPTPVLPQVSATPATPQQSVTDCAACGEPLAPVLIADGERYHVSCEAAS